VKAFSTLRLAAACTASAKKVYGSADARQDEATRHACILHVSPSRCDLGAGLLTLCSVQATKHRKYGLISKHCRGIREAEQADETCRRVILLGKTHASSLCFRIRVDR
jgi:hypothetical protein